MNDPSAFMNVPIFRPQCVMDDVSTYVCTVLYTNLGRCRNFAGNWFKKRKCVLFNFSTKLVGAFV